VYEASAVGLPGRGSRIQTVAVKFLSDAESVDRLAFIDEAVRMVNIYHENIVQLIAVCFSSAPFFIVLEHMANGDLKQFLLAHREAIVDGKPKLNGHELLRFCQEIACGLAYLAKVKFVHRDLAARNVLLDVTERSQAVFY
jgi:proto-oncogene tyrosine-protein kinase ROS